MRKIKEYNIVTTITDFDRSEHCLQNEVNHWIKKGWQPFGSPFFKLLSPGNYCPYQAMVKYEEDE